MNKRAAVLTISTLVALVAMNAFAQSPVRSRNFAGARQTNRSHSPYRFMDSVGYPQEWHAARSTARTPGKSIAPRRTVTLQSTFPSTRTANRSTLRAHQTPRFGSARSSYVAPGSTLPPAIPGSTRTRTTYAASHYDNRVSSAFQPRANKRSSGSIGRAAIRPTEREVARPGRSYSASRPYAFMDTVGFPQEYNQGAASQRSRSNTGSRRSGTPTSQSRSRLEPGFVEVH